MNENGKTIHAEYTISSSLLPLMGAGLYKSHPAVIMVRELIQNSRDACMRRGVAPQISVEIEEADKETIITVTDNGDGMTVDEIIGDFLKVGGRTSKKKDYSREVGGYAVFKVFLSTMKRWECHTHDKIVTPAGEGADINDATEYLDGTRVTVWCKPVTYGTWNKLLAMIYLSEVKVDLSVVRDGKPVLRDKNAGMNGRKLYDFGEEPNGKGGHERTSWNAFGLEPIETNIHTITKCTAYRIHGLVQAIDETWSQRKTNVVIDLTSQSTPRDDDYPFDTAREALRIPELRSQIERLTTRLDVDAQSTEERVKRPPKPEDSTTDFFAGKSVNDRGVKLTNRAVETFVAAHISGREVRGSALPDFSVDQYTGASGYMEDAHMHIVAAWMKIVAAVSPEPCVCGVTGDPWANLASRRAREDGMPVYFIHPEKVVESICEHNVENHEALWLWLWHIAVHEISHIREHSHNESFTRTECGNAIATAEAALVERKSALINCRLALEAIAYHGR